MRRWHRRAWMQSLAALLVSALASGCDKTLKENPLDNPTSLPTMRTHCVGRYLIDLPAEFEQMLSSDVELIYGLGKDFRKVNVMLVRAAGSLPSFDRIVSKRAMELAASEHPDSPSKNKLALQKKRDEKTTLIRGYNSELLDSFRSEYFLDYGSSVGNFTARTFTGDNVDFIEEKLLKVVQKTNFLSTPNQPGRGTCLGPLLIDASQDGEIFSVAFRAASRPDAFIKIDMNSMLAKSDGGLLKRWDSKAGMLNKLNFESSSIRRGEIALGGISGEELLLKGKDHGHTVFGFTAEVLQTKPATFATPSLAIDMNVGGQIPSSEYVDASWSQVEALAIWDAIVKSIRLRPGAI